jgi:polyhydroxyalkanoate synthesis regulator phasin
VEDLATELVKMGQVSEKEGKKFLNDILKKYDDAQLKLEKRVEQSVKELLKKGDIVTGDELKALKKEVREIKRAINKKTEASD